jgi:hypothetical protein
MVLFLGTIFDNFVCKNLAPLTLFVTNILQDTKKEAELSPPFSSFAKQIFLQVCAMSLFMQRIMQRAADKLKHRGIHAHPERESQKTIGQIFSDS